MRWALWGMWLWTWLDTSVGIFLIKLFEVEGLPQRGCCYSVAPSRSKEMEVNYAIVFFEKDLLFSCLPLHYAGKFIYPVHVLLLRSSTMFMSCSWVHLLCSCLVVELICPVHVLLLGSFTLFMSCCWVHVLYLYLAVEFIYSVHVLLLS